ncbi:hypothetical protein ACMD2_14838, partial [Ananas comosus]
MKLMRTWNQILREKVMGNPFSGRAKGPNCIPLCNPDTDHLTEENTTSTQAIRYRPVFGGEVMEQDQHLQLGQLVTRARVGPISKRHEGIGLWRNLNKVREEKM